MRKVDCKRCGRAWCLTCSRGVEALKAGQCRGVHPVEIIVTRTGTEAGWEMEAKAFLRFEIPLDRTERSIMSEALRKLAGEMDDF